MWCPSSRFLKSELIWAPRASGWAGRRLAAAGDPAASHERGLCSLAAERSEQRLGGIRTKLSMNFEAEDAGRRSGLRLRGWTCVQFSNSNVIDAARIVNEFFSAKGVGIFSRAVFRLSGEMVRHGARVFGIRGDLAVLRMPGSEPVRASWPVRANRRDPSAKVQARQDVARDPRGERWRTEVAFFQFREVPCHPGHLQRGEDGTGSIHIAINGHEWLARQLDAEGIGYRRVDNCFLEFQDPQRAQEMQSRLAPVRGACVRMFIYLRHCGRCGALRQAIS